MIATSPNVRFTVRDYYRMSRAGLFDHRRVELIKGRIVRTRADSHAHRWAMSKTARALLPLFPPTVFWMVVRGTVAMDRFNAPDPDFSVLDVPLGTPQHELPLPFLIIEVSDATYSRDRGGKLRVYARTGIPDYWIINLIEARIEVYREPVNPTGQRSDWRYKSVEHFKPGQKIKPLRYPKMLIPVAAMMP